MAEGLQPKCLECKEDLEEDEIIVLQCSHSYCLLCLSGILKSERDDISKCPSIDCDQIVPDRVVGEVLDDRSLRIYQKKTSDSYFGARACLLPECDGMININDTETHYECHICRLFICILCNAPHSDIPCQDYMNNKEQYDEILCQAEFHTARENYLDKEQKDNRANYKKLENEKYLKNFEPFLCMICCKQIKKKCGISLRNCYHYYCTDCFKNYVYNTDIFPINCSYENCDMIIHDRDLRVLLTKQEEQNFDFRMIQNARANMEGMKECGNPECHYIVVIESKYQKDYWICASCKEENCLKCNLIHTGQSCDAFARNHPGVIDKLKNFEINENLMSCLGCKLFLEKISGCDYVKCPRCGAELCWATRKYRYGPGGCNCTKQKRCSPTCKGCNPHACLIM